MKKLLILLLLVVFIATGASCTSRLDGISEPEIPETAGQAVHAVATPAPEAKSSELQGVTNILLIGVDNDNLAAMDEQGNSDGMMLATINAENSEIIFTSFLRDTRVRVNDSYYDKLTNVYHTGGFELLSKTFAENFNIPIDYYAQFNYLDIVALVDAVGGVPVELNKQEIYFMDSKIKNISWLTNTSYEDNMIPMESEGTVTLNGVQAAAYMRIRPAEGNYDFGRTERARNVASQIIKKMYSMGLSDMVNFANTFYKQIKTDIPDDVMIAFALNAGELKSYRQVMDRIPIDGAYSSLNDGSGSYVVPDFEVNNQHLQESLYEGIH